MTYQRLLPCVSCSRHVRVSETTCPFCGVALGARDASVPVFPRGLSRAALLALSATVAGCAASADNTDAQRTDAGAMVTDTGGFVLLYGGPFPTVDAGPDDPGNPGLDYGLPPMNDR